MPTTMASPEKESADLRKLRNLAERKVKEMDALIARLNTALAATRPQPSALDEVHELVEASEDLRVPNGNLSAKAIAEAFGLSMNELAGWLGRSRQALSKTPDADSLQDPLAFFERVARLRSVMPRDRFRKWLRMPHPQLDGKAPMELMASGEGQVVADFVEDMLTGAPS